MINSGISKLNDIAQKMVLSPVVDGERLMGRWNRVQIEMLTQPNVLAGINTGRAGGRQADLFQSVR